MTKEKKKISNKIKEESKKIIEKKEEKPEKAKEDKETKKTDKNKEIVYIIGGLLVLVVVFFAFYFIFRNIGRVEYEGMVFVKEKIGNVTFYHHNYYIKDDMNGKIYSYNLYLRNDPRYNNVNVETDDVSFQLGKPFYLGINSTGLGNCSLSMVAVDTLIQFLMYNNNLIKVNTGTVDKKEAEIKNMTHISCEAHPLNTVIILEQGDETKITRVYDCYHITVANCEITQAVEKFILEALIDAKRAKVIAS